MLASHHRIRNSKHFAIAFSKGVKIVEPGFIAYIYHSSDLEKAAGFIVSKALGNSVKRNLIKRRYRHIVQENLPENHFLVLRARSSSSSFSFEELRKQYSHALESAKRKKEKNVKIYNCNA